MDLTSQNFSAYSFTLRTESQIAEAESKASPQVITSSVTTLLSLLSITTNIINLKIFLRMKDLKIHQYYYIAIAAADVLAVVIFFLLMALKLTTLLDSGDGCRNYAIIGHFPIQIPIILQTAMCVDRCRAITRPVEYRAFINNKRKAQIITKSVILLAFLLPPADGVFITQLGIAHFDFDYSSGGCYLISSVLTFLVMSVTTIWPLVIHIISNTLVVVNLRKLRKDSRQKRIRLYRTTAITLVTFYVCWLPAVITPLISLAGLGPKFLSNSFSAVYILVYLQSNFSILIYYYTLPNFKQELSDLWHQSRISKAC